MRVDVISVNIEIFELNIQHPSRESTIDQCQLNKKSIKTFSDLKIAASHNYSADRKMCFRSNDVINGLLSSFHCTQCLSSVAIVADYVRAPSVSPCPIKEIFEFLQVSTFSNNHAWRFGRPPDENLARMPEQDMHIETDKLNHNTVNCLKAARKIVPFSCSRCEKQQIYTASKVQILKIILIEFFFNFRNKKMATNHPAWWAPLPRILMSIDTDDPECQHL